KLIILPGWGGTSETWADFVEIAKHDFDVQVINLPCFGDEPCPDTVWGVEEYSEFVKKQIIKLSNYQIILLGHSFGGQVASYLVANNPDIANKLILSGPAIFRPKKKLRRIIIGGIAKAGKLIFRLPVLEKFDVEMEKLFRQATGTQDYGNSDGIKRDIFTKVIREDLTEVVKKIKTPTLIIWGTKDTYVPIKNAYKLSKLIANSKLEIIKDGKHGLHIQQPENLLKIIKNFIKSA
ncbi:alpha/beta hydrolase, partial [Patescibacteria group bacterium]|nr:alpha/beta hydrolase [Patescibacteria group bacterium]